MSEQQACDFWERQDAICNATLTGGREESTLKALLFAINRFAGLNGDCYACVDQLASAAGISRRTRQCRMQDLYDLGVIRTLARGGGSGRTNHIVIDLDGLRKLDRKGATSAPVSTERLGATIAPNSAAKGAQSVCETGAIRTEKGRTHCAPEMNEIIRSKIRDELTDGIVFPLADGSDYRLQPKAIGEYAKSHPNVNVLAELHRARQWCRDNPVKRKTEAGMPQFLNNWLLRARKPPDRANRPHSSLSGRRSSAAGEEAWQRVTKAVKRFDPQYENEKLQSLLGEAERAAARAVGGLPKIAGRDRFTETRLRTAFLEAYSELTNAHAG